MNDPSRIAVTGKQLNAAAFVGSRSDPRTLRQQSAEKKRKEEEALNRETQRYAQWSAQAVTIGGVRMTNGEAQAARRRFIENEDYYADRAVRRGDIRDGEQGELKRAMRRRVELEDRVGRGIDTDEDRRELDDHKRSRMGRAVDATTAGIHTGHIAARSEARAEVSRQTSTGGSDALPTAREIFQSTPVAQQAFAQAASPNAANAEAEPVPAAPVPVAPTREAKATGLDL